jgi:hypothetical protein
MTNAPVVAPIVEGHGEVRAVPLLVRRIATEILESWVEVGQPFRLDSSKMRKPDELAKAVRVQATRVKDRGGILILRDGDDSDMPCPMVLAESMAPSAGLVPVPVEIVIAYHEYEAWFLAAAGSLRGHPAVRDDSSTLADAEGKRGVKKQLEHMMIESYKETLHQAKFSALIDLREAANNSRSFQRMIHAIEILTV